MLTAFAFRFLYRADFLACISSIEVVEIIADAGEVHILNMKAVIPVIDGDKSHVIEVKCNFHQMIGFDVFSAETGLVFYVY